MGEFVTDTHPLIWHLTNDKRLSPMCQQFFTEADNGLHIIWIPAITLIEITYLVERSRFPQSLFDSALVQLDDSPQNYRLAPLNLEIIKALRRIKPTSVPEMPDRIIAATALSLNAPLLSKDRAITSVSQLEVLW